MRLHEFVLPGKIMIDYPIIRLYESNFVLSCIRFAMSRVHNLCRRPVRPVLHPGCFRLGAAVA